MPMVSQGTIKAQQSPSQSRNQMDLTSPTMGTADTNMGVAVHQQQQQQQQQQQAAMMRAQQAPPTGGPVMSNGKPALLRGAAARDGNAWAQGPGMVSSADMHGCITTRPCASVYVSSILYRVPAMSHRR